MIILHGKRLTVQIDMVPSEGAKGQTNSFKVDFLWSNFKAFYALGWSSYFILADETGGLFLSPSLLNILFTLGAGNPRVTPEVTRDVCLLARMMAANLYYSQIEDLMFEVLNSFCILQSSPRSFLF